MTRRLLKIAGTYVYTSVVIQIGIFKVVMIAQNREDRSLVLICFLGPFQSPLLASTSYQYKYYTEPLLKYGHHFLLCRKQSMKWHSERHFYLPKHGDIMVYSKKPAGLRNQRIEKRQKSNSCRHLCCLYDIR